MMAFSQLLVVLAQSASISDFDTFVWNVIISAHVKHYYNKTSELMREQLILMRLEIS